MGYMTTITILNDGFDQIEQHPNEFVKNIVHRIYGIDRLNYRKQRSINEYGVGNHANVMKIAKPHHADEPRMFIAFQNSLGIIGLGNDSEHIEYRKHLLKIAKEMIKYEEEAIKKLEEDMK